MYLAENLQKKWGPVLEHEDLPKIKDNYRKAVTAVLLENQETAMKEQSQQGSGVFMTEAAHANKTGGNIDTVDPVLISLVRRAMPNLIAYDVCGVQPMTGPTGLIFAMKSHITSQAGVEAADSKEADTSFSGSGTHSANSNPADASMTTGTGTATATQEADVTISEMAFAIDKVTVTAKSRALKAEYTVELAQDLKAVHGLDAETELSNILSSEILAEINREVMRTIYTNAKTGAAHNTTSAGTFDLDTDSNGRWSVEKFKGLMFQIEREANAIAKDTRRGKGNVLITSSDVASALAMAGQLSGAPSGNDFDPDDTGSTMVGTLNGRFKVYVDPYAPSAATNYFTVGYKGSSAYDAGLFYCPYVPLQMVRAVGENSFQPKIGFKTRYGLVSNPFANETGSANNGAGDGSLTANANRYYRHVIVANLM
tara:strand:+ start:5560 stop:6840 length:1281 start_codon:yes stop_codon:yes gene_type:complete